MNRISRFTDLTAWNEAHQLVLLVYKITKSFPKEEQFGLVNQSRRAVISITSNIAEGFGRNSAKDKQHFYTMAKTSLSELENQCIATKDLLYIREEVFREFYEQLSMVERLINGLTRSAVDFVR